MSFQPVVTLTKVPRDSKSFVLTDATPTGGTSGWGSPNAPASPAAITSLYGSVQGYGEEPVNATGSSGSVATTMTFVVSVIDGVNNFYAYYGLQDTLTNYLVSADGLTITSTDPNLSVILDNVKAISLDGNTAPSLILSISNGVITLASPLTANATGTTIFKYWQAVVRGLVVNNGDAIVANAISLMPIEVDSCENGMKILTHILLRLSAEIAFGCGNISKAHEAARLLSGTAPKVDTNCKTCG